MLYLVDSTGKRCYSELLAMNHTVTCESVLHQLFAHTPLARYVEVLVINGVEVRRVYACRSCHVLFTHVAKKFCRQEWVADA
jgi:hypothetical protein